jgi:penicillin-binding protein 1A
VSRTRAALVASSLALAACTTASDDGALSSFPTTPVEATAPATAVLDRHGAVLGTLPADAGAGWAALLQASPSAATAGGPSVVSTTIDAAMQTALERAVARVPSTAGRFVVAAVALDVTSGQVRAAAASDGAGLALVTPRPTGSALKFVVAAAAIAEGARSDDVLDGSTHCTFGTPRGLFSVDGDPAAHPATVRTAAARSVNCAFARLYLAVGAETVVDLGTRLGLESTGLGEPQVVIGEAAVSPLDMAAAFLPIVGDGTYREPVIDAANIEEADQRTVRALSPAVAATTAELLGAVVGPGGTAVGAALEGSAPSAAKTGTQDGNTDAWIVGGTSQTVVAVWMGNPAVPTDEMVDISEFGDVARVRGGTYPALVWKAFLDDVPAPAAAGWTSAARSRAPVVIVAPGADCPASGEILDADPGVAHVPIGTVVEPCPPSEQ